MQTMKKTCYKEGESNQGEDDTPVTNTVDFEGIHKKRKRDATDSKRKKVKR